MDNPTTSRDSASFADKWRDISRRDLARIEELVAAGLEKGKIIELVLFEGVRRDGPSFLPFYCAKGEEGKGEGERLRGIVRVIDGKHRYIRIEEFKAGSQQMFDIFGSAIHSYEINHRNYSPDDGKNRIAKEHATWGKNVS